MEGSIHFSPKPEDKEPKSELKAEVLDGAGAKDLHEAMHMYTLENGMQVWAGTDQGVGYKDHNEDRVAVVPGANFAAVVDGMGGYGGGDVAAQILAEEFGKSPEDLTKAISSTLERYKQNGIHEGGAVFVTARITTKDNKRFLNVEQIGDAKVVVISKKGKVRFESQDESLVASLLKERVITPDQALYNPHRNKVSRAVDLHESFLSPKSYEPIALEEGDVVLLMSDGISDNFTAEEIAEIATGDEPHMTAAELFFWLNYATGARMADASKLRKEVDRNKVDKYSDGFKSEPKEDNRALVIMKVN